MAEPALTRRRSDNPNQETWHIYFGDVHVGWVGVLPGVPVGTDQWAWSCGFQPDLDPGQNRAGSAKTFEQARACFDAAWSKLLLDIPDSALEEWRRDRDWRAEMRAKRARGERLESEIPNTLMRCPCGTVFDGWKPAESYPHRAHIYAAQAAD